MITVEEIANQALLELKKESPDSDITVAQAELMVQQSLAAVVREKLEGENIRGEKATPPGSLYFRFNNIPVVGDDVKTFELPASPMSSREGYDVIVQKDVKTPEYQQLPHTYTSIKNSRTRYLAGRLGYIIEGKTGCFIDHPGHLEPPETVTIKMLAPIQGIHPEAYPMITAELQEMVVDRTVKKMLRIDQIPEDQIANDVDQP